MSDDRWTEEEIEAVRGRIEVIEMASGRRLAYIDGATEDELRALLTTALDALRARPRWVRAGDFDPETMQKTGAWIQPAHLGLCWLVVPLPLPPLPEEEG